MAYIPTYEREAREEGIQLGIKKGKEEANLNTARELLANGVDINIIAKSTGIPKEKIESLTPTTH